MGQIQQICEKNTPIFESSLNDFRQLSLDQEYIGSNISYTTFEQSTMISDTSNELRFKLSQDEKDQNYKEETNISFCDSFRKLGTHNLSQKELNEITEFNNLHKTKNRSKSTFVLKLFPELPLKGILKNKEMPLDQEKTNIPSLKRVRFTIKYIQKNKLNQKYDGYTKISYL